MTSGLHATLMIFELCPKSVMLWPAIARTCLELLKTFPPPEINTRCRSTLDGASIHSELPHYRCYITLTRKEKRDTCYFRGMTKTIESLEH